MRYLPLFDLRLRHTYYSDGWSPDFVIEPTPETTRLLTNHRSMTKPLVDGLRVITTVAASGEAYIAIPREAVLRFDMRVLNPEFALITETQDLANSASRLYSNVDLAAATETELTLLDSESWSQETLAVVRPSDNEQWVLSGAPIEGMTAAKFTLSTTGPLPIVVAYNPKDKLITVDSSAASPGQRFTLSYPITTPMPRGVFARIEIHANDSLPKLNTPTSVPREFRISYRAKQARWAYYCVTDLAEPDVETAYHIVDTPPASEDAPLVFSDINSRNLVTQPDPLDELAAELVDRYPGLQLYRFLSDATVSCRQTARKHLALEANGNELSTALPNPSVRNFATGRIKVGGAVQEQDWLFQIVKVLTHNGV